MVRKNTINDPLVNKFVSMTETELQMKVVEPLFRALGFHEVRDTSGSEEKGKDLVAIKRNEYGDLKYSGIQIKKYKPSAKVGGTSSYGKLADQLRQLINEPIVDPITIEEKFMDEWVFITPYPLDVRTTEKFRNQLLELKKNGLIIIDGIKLAYLVREKIPHEISFIDGEEQYRLDLNRRINIIEETPIALQIRKQLELDQIYVEAFLTGETTNVVRLVESSFKIPEHSYGVVYDNDLKILENIKVEIERKRLYELFNRDFKKPKKEKVFSSKTRDIKHRASHIVKIDTPALFKNLKKTAPSRFKLRKLVERESGKLNIPEIFDGLRKSSALILKAKSIPYVDSLWNECLNVIKEPLSIWPGHLIYSETPICILGPAGAGKSTLLKRLAQIILRVNDAPTPIFIPLIRLKTVSIKGIWNYCTEDLIAGGYPFKVKSKMSEELLTLLGNGNFYLLFDGLDELGSNAELALNAIKSINLQFPKTPVIISCRNSFEFQWDIALTMELQPFTNEQVEEFISKWFSSEPLARKLVLDWIQSKKAIREIATTPLIAALLCSLYAAKVELPNSENDLYERRLELLLGRWDTAKSESIPPLPMNVRDMYLYFLMKLAFYMHSSQLREMPLTKVVDFSNSYRMYGHHSLKNSLVLDCIGRNLLIQNEKGEVSFGHLTFQEHLSARWLSHHNPVTEMVEYVNDPYWEKVLIFYATKKYDITFLVKAYKNKYGSASDTSLDQIRKFVKYAPLTDSRVISLHRQV